MPKNIYDVFTDMKTEKSHKDIQVRSSDPSTLHVARLRHPPIEGSQVRTHAAPDLSEASRKKKSEWQGNAGNSEGDGVQW